jgi:magnesium-transporting ATPase (P-type)
MSVCAVSPPADYDEQYKRFASQGARVIALAHRDFGAEQVKQTAAWTSVWLLGVFKQVADATACASY